ncbi:uncharacterized protein PAC_18675 [Phialocephala subalpina]|uniref:GDP-mannose transporter n=1 Tax=Phialocephala subalpina TaxID=576137 RepID=A0A1L7XUT2_9HELO|nr:uncharacterized protein PAC_18675 [Phialocephala subalpina]
MFSPRNTESSNPFKPALQYLISAGRNPSKHRQSNSSGSLDSDGEGTRSRMSYQPKSSNEFRQTSIPLISISRSPSPFRRRHSDSNPASETDDDDWGDYPNSSRQPFLPDASKLTGWQWLMYGGGFGHFFFNTPVGWQLYIGILVLWLGGCQIGLTIMNRIILWSGYLQNNYTAHTKLITLIAGVYKFPYPLTTTLIEMLMTHFWITLSAYITRWVSPWLISSGCSGGIAPSRPAQSPSSPGFRGQGKSQGFLGAVLKWASYHTGGIAGGGFFEFDLKVAKTVLPVAIIFVAKVCLSNLSFAYAQIQIYTLARIGIVPLSLFFTYFLGQTPHSVSTISAALTATLALLVAVARANVRVTWESIVAGVFSSIFVALYPVQLQRTYKSLVAQLVPQGDLLGTFPSSTGAPADYSGSREEARAYWRLLHYTSMLSILLFTPIVFLSGEVTNIWRNCYFLDVFFHWLMVVCGGLGSWAVFWATMALTRATSPLTTTFLFIPRAAFLLPIMAGWKMPAYSWVGFLMCWASCAWFLRGRRKEGRGLERLR